MLVRSTDRQTLRSPRQAFTLLEVLVVVAIIVMLAGVGSYYVYQRFEEAKVSRAKIDCKNLYEQVGMYRLANEGEIPANLQVLAGQQPNGGDPLVTPDKLMDPWNKPYQIQSDGHNYKIVTTSPKGQAIDNLTK
jgi:general secretion pathway protein G